MIAPGSLQGGGELQSKLLWDRHRSGTRRGLQGPPLVLDRRGDDAAHEVHVLPSQSDRLSVPQACIGSEEDRRTQPFRHRIVQSEDIIVGGHEGTLRGLAG